MSVHFFTHFFSGPPALDAAPQTGNSSQNLFSRLNIQEASGSQFSLDQRKITCEVQWKHILAKAQEAPDSLWNEISDLLPEKDALKSHLGELLMKLKPKMALEILDKMFFYTLDNETAGFQDLILEASPLELYENILNSETNGQFQDIREWAERIAKSLSSLPAASPATAASDSDAPHASVITSFFPNLAHIFLQTFNLFDSARPPESLYEYGVLINLYFHFFTIPYYLILALGQVIASPWIVFAAAAAILITAVGGLYIYLKYLRKCPTEVAFCENLSKRNASGNSRPVLGRENEYKTINQILGINEQRKGDNVVIVGSPGVGKTEFMEGLAEKLPDYQVFKFKNWSLFGAGGSVLSAGEKMDMALKEFQGFENKVVVLYDELGDGIKNSGFADYLKLVLPTHKVRFVAAMTASQWEKFKSDNSENGFEERFTPLHLEPTKDPTTKEILRGRVNLYASDLPISDEALDTIIELTKNAPQAQPRASIRTLDEIIGKCRQFDTDSFESEDLQNIHKEISYLEKNIRNHYSDISELCNQIKNKEDKTRIQNELEKKSGEAKEALLLLKKHMDLLRGFETEFKQLALAITQGKCDEISKKRFAFDQIVAIPTLTKKIRVLKGTLPKEAWNTCLYIDAPQVKHLLEEKQRCAVR